MEPDRLPPTPAHPLSHPALQPERCWSRLARPDGPGRDCACALAAIRLATALLTHLPSSEVTEVSLGFWGP